MEDKNIVNKDNDEDYSLNVNHLLLNQQQISLYSKVKDY